MDQIGLPFGEGSDSIWTKIDEAIRNEQMLGLRQVMPLVCHSEKAETHSFTFGVG